MELMFTVCTVVGLIAFANMAVGAGVKFRAWLGRVAGGRIRRRRTLHASQTSLASGSVESSIVEKFAALVIGALVISLLFTVIGFAMGLGIAMIPGMDSHLSWHVFFACWAMLFVVFALLILASAIQNGRL